MATSDTMAVRTKPAKSLQVILYGHSPLLYWWPVWAAGYVMALLTWLYPLEVQIDGTLARFSSLASLGVIYALVVLLTILITNTHMRGLMSLVSVLAVAFMALLIAYFDWWPTILSWLGQRSVYMDMGFYLFISTALLAIWLMVVVVFDHMSFWRIRPGQITHEYVLGALQQSFDTDNMVFTKQQSDIFRNWVLGLGSGEVQMQTMGGRGVVATVSNVLFLNSRVKRIQQLIATKPDLPVEA